MVIGALTALDMLSTAHSAISAAAKKPDPSTEASAASSFAAILGNATNDTVSSMHNAERLSVDALQGNADMRTVIDAVMDAEQSLKAAISIRDKIVSSYLEITRMAI